MSFSGGSVLQFSSKGTFIDPTELD